MGADYDAILVESPVWMAVIDSEGVCHNLSAGWRAGLDLDPDADLAFPLAELLAADEDAVRHAVAEALNNRSVIQTMATRLATPSGSVPGHLSLWPTSVGEDKQSIALVSVADQQTQAEVARLQQRQDLILEAAGEGVYGLDNRGCTTFANTAASEILGWREEDVNRVLAMWLV